MPQDDEIPLVKQKLYDIARFPRCIGTIDYALVKIQSPGLENSEIIRNRKQFFSLNVQCGRRRFEIYRYSSKMAWFCS
nr:unnamed protein product [Callosobruchus analis]